MKKVLAVSGIILGIVLTALIALLIHAGLFFKVQVTEAISGPFTIVYTEQTGDYSKANKAGMDIYQTLIAEFGVNPTKGFGIYYDNPQTVAKDKLRSEIGCILEGNDILKAPAITSKFKVRILEPKTSLVATHPFTNPLSIMLGIAKVYPKFGALPKEKTSAYTYSMEIYDMPAKKTVYLMR
ncbi:MAG TPA: GyrI-like domain-containing protein [Candidatus Goldiibacteriota bacterium]|nr:GyrI-like domain-containing protein [Candidatus Goldiibacteriota bacterium]